MNKIDLIVEIKELSKEKEIKLPSDSKLHSYFLKEELEELYNCLKEKE